MSSARFHVVDVNPNDSVGGAGCLCSETKDPDCKGPYAVFFHTEMASNLSPHPVLCLACAEAFVKKAAGGDVLAGGEPTPDADPTNDVPLDTPSESEPDDDEIPEV